MAEDDLEVWIGIENPAQYQAKTLCRGFYGEPPGGAQQRGIPLHIVLVVGLDDSGMR